MHEALVKTATYLAVHKNPVCHCEKNSPAENIIPVFFRCSKATEHSWVSLLSSTKIILSWNIPNWNITQEKISVPYLEMMHLETTRDAQYRYRKYIGGIFPEIGESSQSGIFITWLVMPTSWGLDKWA